MVEEKAPENLFQDIYTVLIRFGVVDPSVAGRFEVHCRPGGISAIKFPSYERVLTN